MTGELATGEALRAYSTASKRTFGRRRTAFPLDMTLTDLISRRIAIAPRIKDRTRAVVEVNASKVLRQLRKNRPAVLLGMPGAGKSMALLQLAAAWESARVAPILLRIADVVQEVGTLQNLLTENHDRQPVLLLDGLDEAMSTPESRPEVARTLRALMNAAPTLLTSRTRDFEEAAYLDRYGVVFDDVYELLPWRPEVEFANFLRQLHAGGHISENTLLADVVNSPKLSRLATRPLHARMLTFVMEINPENPPESLSDLYGTYLYHLSKVADASLAGRGCYLPRGAVGYWMDACWAIYSLRTATPEPNAVIKATGVGDGLTANCLLSAIDVIADRFPHGGQERIEFVHYSFFEWLLAARIRERLSEIPMTVELLFEIFSRDLPRDVRHYLRQQVGSMSAEMTNDLVDKYLGAHQRTVDGRATLVVCNLIVYLISRCAPTAAVALQSLLEKEREPFLANALLWSLTHLGDRAATVDFFRRFSLDDDWRRMTRGYTLYYYGDLGNVSGPPFLDSTPYGTYDRSFQSLSEILASATSQRISVERQAVDLVTILDILDIRNIRLARDQLIPIVDAAARVVDSLRMPEVAHQINSRLSRIST